VEEHFVEQDMELLTGKLELISHAVEKVRSQKDLESLMPRLDDSLVGHHGLTVTLRTPEGRTLFTSGEATFPQVLLDHPWPEGTSPAPTEWHTDDKMAFRGFAASIPTGAKDRAPLTVGLAIETVHHEHFMQSFQARLWLFVIVAALVIGFAGWAAVRRGLAPLRAIRQEAADITASRLDRRLSVESVPSELAELAVTFNEMLFRLEESFKRLSDFSSDLAHELRTPVSNLLTQTQVTLSQPRTAEEYRDILASNAEEFERLSRMIADMLFLAKSDNDLSIPHQEPVDLAAEVQGLFEYYEILAEDKGITLQLKGSGVVQGDRLMLRRAISNLLSNAVRHTPQGGHVVVHIKSDENGALRLSVENNGETIPAEHVPRLFDRFYRVDASRRRFSEGAGLGLAITRSILRAHGGDAEVSSAEGLTCVSLMFPAQVKGDA
jgi:two-component system heavy metal sensor histidine kinase CusS